MKNTCKWVAVLSVISLIFLYVLGSVQTISLRVPGVFRDSLSFNNTEIISDKVSEVDEIPTVEIREPTENSEFFTGCEYGYYPNPDTKEHKCIKIRVCNTGYKYNAATNKCDKIVCPYGFKVGEDGMCREFECNVGKIISIANGKCTTNNGKVPKCEAGTAYSTTTKKCEPLISEDAPECSDEQFLEKTTSKSYTCRDIANPEAYSSWRKEELVAMSDSATIKDGGFVENGEVIMPIGIILSDSTSSGVDSSKLANIMDEPYAELREIISEILEEQAMIEKEEEDAAIAEATKTEKEKVCPEGKVLNKETGRCRTKVTVTKTATSVTTVTFDEKTGETTTVKTCVSGYTLNKETNRCVKNSAAATKSAKICPEGQYLNPLTNRCKKLVTITTSSTSTTTTTFDPITGEYITTKTCIDGYELNPKTNRCIKVKENSGAEFGFDTPLLSEAENNPKTFIALSAVITATALGVIFTIFQFRSEIRRFFHKIFRKKS